MRCYLLCFLLLFGYVSAQAPFVKWEVVIGGTGQEIISEMSGTSDGNFIVFGHSSSGADGNKTSGNQGSSDLFLTKLDTDGNILFDRSYGSSAADDGLQAINTSDGGYLMLGRVNGNSTSGDLTDTPNGNADFWLVKTDAGGTIQWNQAFGGTGADRPWYAIEHGGFYYAVGYSSSGINGEKTSPNRGNDDILVIKLSTTGTVVWDRTFGGSGQDRPEHIAASADGHLLILGYTTSAQGTGNKTAPSKGGQDMWLVKIDTDGNKLWDRTYGHTGTDEGEEIIAANDGGYILLGNSDSPIGGDKSEASRGGRDYWVVKINGNGTKIWDKTIGSDGTTENARAITAVADGYVMVGSSAGDINGDKTQPSRGSSDAWMIKIDNQGNYRWDKVLGGNMGDPNPQIITLADNSLVMAVGSDSDVSGDKFLPTFGNRDFWVVRLAPEGENMLTGTLLAGATNYDAGDADGTGTTARFHGISDLVYNPNDGNYYATDPFNHRIRRITSAGVVTTIAGTGVPGSADGLAGSATFRYPFGICMDAGNNVLYVADKGNHMIRKITLGTNMVSTLAGDGTAGSTNGNAAQFNEPSDVAFSGGTVFVADSKNHVIRSIVAATGNTATHSGNGTAGLVNNADPTLCEYNYPISLAVDGADLYVSDHLNHAIREVALTGGGASTYLGGNGKGYIDGSNTFARLNRPTGIVFNAGTLYFTDFGSKAVRRYTFFFGFVETVSGDGTPGLSQGVGSRYLAPLGIATDGSEILVVDGILHRIVKLN